MKHKAHLLIIASLVLVTQPVLSSAQETVILGPTTALTTPYESGTNPTEPAKLEEGIPPVEHPDGPKCDPGETDCDISTRPNALTRDRAEGDNTLEAFFFDGVTLVHPLWKATGVMWSEGEMGYEPYGLQDLKEKFKVTTGANKNTYTLNRIAEAISTENLTGILDSLLKNFTPYDLIFENNIVDFTDVENDQLNPLRSIQPLKTAPGVFPLGHQYELEDAAANKIAQALSYAQDTGLSAESTKPLTPSYKYLMVPQKGESYLSDTDRPIISDTLERQLRIARDYLMDGRGLADFRSIAGGLFRSDKASIGTFNKQSFWEGNIFFFSFWNSNYKPYTTALSECYRRGGHLPTMEEMVLMREYLPANTSGTKDQLGNTIVDTYLTSDFMAWLSAVGEIRPLGYAPYIEKDNNKGRAFAYNISNHKGIESDQSFHEQAGNPFADTYRSNVNAVCVYN